MDDSLLNVFSQIAFAWGYRRRTICRRFERTVVAALPLTWRHFIGGDDATEQPPSCNWDDGKPQKSKNYVTFQISIHLPVTIKQNCSLRHRAKLIATRHSPRNMETKLNKFSPITEQGLWHKRLLHNCVEEVVILINIRRYLLKVFMSLCIKNDTFAGELTRFRRIVLLSPPKR